MKKAIISVVISSCVLLGSCRKCYDCVNGCRKQISTQQLICSTDYSGYAEYNHVLDSLATLGDIEDGVVAIGTFYKKACSDDEVSYYKSLPGISCTYRPADQ